MAPLEQDAIDRELDCLTTIGLVAGRVAHDINNPLAGIQNSFMLVRDAIPESHPHYRYVAAIEREIARIAQVTRRLVDAYPAGYERGGITPVADVAAEAIRLAQPFAGAGSRGVVVDNQVARTIAPEPELLRQAMRLLLASALQALDPDQPVHFALAREGDELVIALRYCGDAPQPSLERDPYPSRLIAVLGGQWQVECLAGREILITLRVPVADSTP